MYVYVASSWRNRIQPSIIEALRAEGIDCYDFRHPAPGDDGFSWKEVGGDGESAPGETPVGKDLVDTETYARMLAHPRAREGFSNDFSAMQRADAIVLVLPCGKSAHLELGWAVGAGKRTAILTQEPIEPELMYLMVDLITPDLTEIMDWLEAIR